MSRFSVGELIDERFEITGKLGHGGMAQVYRALDRHLEREVALKALRPHLTEADSERFRREIMTLAKLSHPNIVSIYDLGRGEHIYFAMELIPGGPFTDLGPLEGDLEPLLGFLDAAISVAEALAYVHRLGMVHRDLTPRNILLSATGQPKVMDFGLVQLAEASRQLTRTGLTLGTPQYMAPEQAQGDVTGAHTDLYSLGAVFYKTVTGVAPFDAENDLTLLYQHVYSELTPPLELNADLPPSLAAVIESLLAKTPADRPPSGERVADALRTVRAEVSRRSSAQRLGGPGQRGLVAGGPISPGRLGRAWQLKLAEGPQWPSAITAADGFVLLGTRGEEVVVVHPADGGVQARFRADDEVNSAVVWSGDKLFYTSRAGALSAHAWPSGTRAWNHPEAGAVGLLPCAGELLVTTRTGLERRTPSGEVRWRYPCNETRNETHDAPPGHKPHDEAVTAPTVAGRLACFVTRAGWLHLVDAQTGQGRFKLELGSCVAQPAATASVLLLPERSGDLHAFDLTTREVRWSYDMEGQLWATPLVWERFVYCASWAGVMRCLSLKTGDDVWETELGARVTAAPILASGVLYAVTEAGEVVALDARGGQRLFTDQVASSPIQASPLILGETLLVAALDGTVRAYR